MADKAMDNNQVTIVGTVDSEFTYSHEVLYAGGGCQPSESYGGSDSFDGF